MRAGKLVALLHSFSGKERKRLQEFIASPYFNKNQTLISFVSYMIKHLNKWTEEGEGVEEEKLYAYLFPKTHFDKSKLYYLRSDATALIEQFIVYERVTPDSYLQQTQLLEFHIEKELLDYFETAHKKLSDSLNKADIRDGEYYYQCFYTEWLNIQYQDRFQNEGKDLSNAHYLLDAFYSINKLSLYFSYIASNGVFNWKEGATQPVQFLLTFIDQNPEIKNIPAIQVFSSQINMLMNPNDDKALEAAFQIMLVHKAVLPRKVITACITGIQNILISRINQGVLSYESKLLSIFKLRIEMGLILDSDQEMSPTILRNIVVLALRLKEFTWAEEFLREYEQYLSPRVQESVSSHIWAKVYFEQKQYDKVLKTLFRCESHPDVLFDINSRKLLIQTYFELGEMENVLNTLNSFRVFISRNKVISEPMKLLNQNFAIVMHKLTHTDLKTPQKRTQFHNLVLETQPLGEKGWFLEKAVG